MEEQLFCSKCGKLNWSRWAKTCECQNPDFKYSHYVDYLRDLEAQQRQEDEFYEEHSPKSSDFI